MGSFRTVVSLLLLIGSANAETSDSRKFHRLKKFHLFLSLEET